MNSFNYNLNTVPDDYKCSKCSITNVKLWREKSYRYTLFCAKCSIQISKEDNRDDIPANINDIDNRGMFIYTPGIALNHRMKTNEIGELIPAVPYIDEYGYWASGIVPQKGYDWWASLPNY